MLIKTLQFYFTPTFMKCCKKELPLSRMVVELSPFFLMTNGNVPTSFITILAEFAVTYNEFNPKIF